MREIKFRAWSIEKQCWVYFGLDNVPSWVHPAEVEQYTGLKDKNGMEIYEGDILKTSNKSSELWHVDYKPSAFMVNQGNVNYDCVLSDFMDTETVEVIGNIYENPELLK